MKINRSAIKHNSKYLISITKPSPILVVLIYSAIIFILEWISQVLSGLSQVLTEYYEDLLAAGSSSLPPLPQFSPPSPISILFLIAIGIMSLMLSVGLTIYFLNAASQNKCSYGNLFDGFYFFGRVLWLHILMFIFVYLWSLLFIIPGIVAAYRYRMALYIMIDNPEMSALDCIGKSKEMMLGYKGELFVLDLSFIGWFLLTIIPFMTILVTPYVGLTYANFYLALRNMPKDGSRVVYC